MTPKTKRLALMISLIGAGLGPPLRAMGSTSVLLHEFAPPTPDPVAAGAMTDAGLLRGAAIHAAPLLDDPAPPDDASQGGLAEATGHWPPPATPAAGWLDAAPPQAGAGHGAMGDGARGDPGGGSLATAHDHLDTASPAARQVLDSLAEVLGAELPEQAAPTLAPGGHRHAARVRATLNALGLDSGTLPIATATRAGKATIARRVVRTELDPWGVPYRRAVAGANVVDASVAAPAPTQTGPPAPEAGAGPFERAVLLAASLRQADAPSPTDDAAPPHGLEAGRPAVANAIARGSATPRPTPAPVVAAVASTGHPAATTRPTRGAVPPAEPASTRPPAPPTADPDARPTASIAQPGAAPARPSSGAHASSTALDPWGYPYRRAVADERGPTRAIAGPAAGHAQAGESPTPALVRLGRGLAPEASPRPSTSPREQVLSMMEQVLSDDWSGPTHAVAMDRHQPLQTRPAGGDGGGIERSDDSRAADVLDLLADVLASDHEPGRRTIAGVIPSDADRMPSPQPFGSAAVAVREDALGEVRGGFTTPDGLRVSFGIERAVFVNGSLVSDTRLTVTDLGQLTGGARGSASIPADAMAIVQNGAGNRFQTGPIAAGHLGTVIQNALNGQQIEVTTTINATANSLGILRSMNAEATLRAAIVDSIRR